MVKRKSLFVLLLATALTTGCVPVKFQFDQEFGGSGSSKGQFLSATNLELNKHGDLVVGDNGNSRYQVIRPDGSVKMMAGEAGRDGYKLLGMSGIGVNALTDDVWVCDQRGNKIVRFDPEGTPNMKVTAQVKYPMDVALDRNGDAYVIMAKNPKIHKYTSEGQFVEAIGGTGKTALIFPTSILINDSNIFVSDYGGKRILKLDKSGNFVSEFKEKGEYEEMKGPSSLHIDKEGNMYILDLGEVPVVQLGPDGKLISK
ncbi:MAG: NHL repeat-containing protein, partial [Candidatus Riflebacteria bacterium]